MNKNNWNREKLFYLDMGIRYIRRELEGLKPYDVFYQKTIKKLVDKLKFFIGVLENEDITYYEGVEEFFKEDIKKYEKIIKNYKEGILEKPDKTILIFYGPSASGKTSLAFNLEKHLPRLITHTTRKKRVGEVDGYHYHFVDNEEFKKLNLIEEPENYDRANYGLSKKELDNVFSKSDVASAVMTKNGIYALSRYSEYDIRPIYVTAPVEVISKRLKDTDKSMRTYEEKFNRLFDVINNWRYAETKITDNILNTAYLDEEECVDKVLNLLDKIGVDYNGKDQRDMS